MENGNSILWQFYPFFSTPGKRISLRFDQLNSSQLIHHVYVDLCTNTSKLRQLTQKTLQNPLLMLKSGTKWKNLCKTLKSPKQCPLMATSVIQIQLHQMTVFRTEWLNNLRSCVFPVFGRWTVLQKTTQPVLLRRKGTRETYITQGVTSQSKIMYRPVFVPFRFSNIPAYVVPSRRV